jgi:hypothetical protein
MDFRKQAKESRTKKLHQLTVSAPDAKTDASDFTPYADPNMDKKTGKRPINPRNFKRGGKVAALEGATAKKRGDRMGAKGRKAKQVGGEISAEDRARLTAMAEEASKARPSAQEIKSTKDAQMPLPSRRPQEPIKFRAKEDIKSPYKKGGRTKKMMGGDITAAGNPQIPSARGNTSLIRKAVGLDYKKGGRTKKETGGGMRSELTEYEKKNRATQEEYDRAAEKYHSQSKKNWEESGGNARETAPSSRKHGGAIKKMNGGPLMAGPAQTLMKRKMPMNNPAAKAPAVMPMRAKGGKVHSDEAMDKALIKKMVKPEARKEKMCGGRTKRASGGRAKGKSNINIVIAPQPAAQGPMPMGGMPPRPPMPMPMPPAPGGMPPGAMPPGAGGMPMPMPVPVPMGGGAPAPQAAGVPGIPGMAPLPRKSGGRVKSFKDITAGAGSGEGRLQKEEMQEYKRTARKAGGKVPNMHFGAGSGPGRIEKIHAYGENPHGEAAPKPQKRSYIK